MGASAIAVPTSFDYTAHLPASLGAMLNDTLGDCAEAAIGHGEQVWSVAAGKSMLTLPDSCIESMYESQGYVPGNAATDQGTVLQSLLTYLVQTGIPLADGSRQKLFAFVELDPTNEDDLNRATYESGFIYIGMNVPKYAEQALDTLGSLLDVDPNGDPTIIGGHCVICAGASPGRRPFISYGNKAYAMTTAYWHQNVDEAYALVSPEFCAANGMTPLGQTLDFWDSQMIAIRGVSS
jgi:hypothetical protein